LTGWSSNDCGFIMTSKFLNGTKSASTSSDWKPLHWSRIGR
jgi:hypothetical protein